MKLRLIAFLAAGSMLALSSCRDKLTGPPNPTNSTDTVWTPINTNTNNDLVVGQFVNPSTGFVAGANGVFLITNDSGKTWSPGQTVPTQFGGNEVYGLSFFDATTGFAAADQRVISKTTDGGFTWQTMNTDNMPQTDLVRSICFTNRNTGFAGTSDAYANPSGSICESMDGGQTWNPMFSTSGGIYDIEFSSFSNEMTGVALGRFGVAYWTSDGGSTWNAGSSDQANSLISRAVFTSSTNGFAVAASLNDTQHGYILKTTDAGHTWHTIYSTASGAVDGIATNGNGKITAVGYSGIVIESNDDGATWAVSNAGSGRWTDVRYASQHRAVLFGIGGAIDVRDN